MFFQGMTISKLLSWISNLFVSWKVQFKNFLLSVWWASSSVWFVRCAWFALRGVSWAVICCVAIESQPQQSVQGNPSKPVQCLNSLLSAAEIWMLKQDPIPSCCLASLIIQSWCFLQGPRELRLVVWQLKAKCDSRFQPIFLTTVAFVFFVTADCLWVVQQLSTLSCSKMVLLTSWSQFLDQTSRSSVLQLQLQNASSGKLNGNKKHAERKMIRSRYVLAVSMLSDHVQSPNHECSVNSNSNFSFVNVDPDV